MDIPHICGWRLLVDPFPLLQFANHNHENHILACVCVIERDTYSCRDPSRPMKPKTLVQHGLGTFSMQTPALQNQREREHQLINIEQKDQKVL